MVMSHEKVVFEACMNQVNNLNSGRVTVKWVE